MSDDGPIARLLHSTARAAGRRYAESKRAYGDGQTRADSEGPYDEHARIVCRRYAQKRTVVLDGYEPDCFEAGHPDCEGCLEDVREGSVETW
ncbi:DUF7091 family protein [Halococcus sediminicola]|uniref:DUF7091 family protein n=1 Tax=Halococcus sediminicola TaxID=1264579 RepID=UPI000678F007|nr:hypothetical protein [Halococcus sediminicola]